MRTSLLLALGAACVYANGYDSQPSGYGDNNPKHVQYVAGKSPKNKPVDYTKSNDAPGSNVFGNWFNTQNLGQANNQGQQSVQQGGNQINAGSNQNAVNVGQSNNQGGRGGGPYRDAPAYGGNQGPNYGGSNYGGPNYGGSNYGGPNYGGNYGANGGANILGNNFNQQALGQLNNQGQSNAQVGGAQTNYGSNANAVNVGQSNNQGGNGGNYGGNYGGNSGYKPSYDAPNYGGSGGAYIIPIYPSVGSAGNIKGNTFDLQTLGQANAQGQQNYQQGGAQTNLGQNQNAVNVGQSNNQGGGAGYGKPSYDAPSYGGNAGGAIYVPDFGNFLKNNVYSQNLGQANAQGQANYQKGGDQANVGVNTNEVNVGQSNNQNTNGHPSYDAPRNSAPKRNPPPRTTRPPPRPTSPPPRTNNVVGNRNQQQNLGQKNNQGQGSVQVGGEQRNIGINQNIVNVSQSNNQTVG
ncbi:unnamed protein product [Nippostrongylus brasiliensis]|uniref:Hyphally regulated cell wall protein 1 n=1 Tax=Nippostrongylus brasiliensis TaxID=27835 RepID=A0A0N4YGH3_NIPBR|nr:unnamed protein product [Nippostrongylus brasiliensis]